MGENVSSNYIISLCKTWESFLGIFMTCKIVGRWIKMQTFLVSASRKWELFLWTQKEMFHLSSTDAPGKRFSKTWRQLLLIHCLLFIGTNRGTFSNVEAENWEFYLWNTHSVLLVSRWLWPFEFVNSKQFIDREAGTESWWVDDLRANQARLARGLLQACRCLI